MAKVLKSQIVSVDELTGCIASSCVKRNDQLPEVFKMTVSSPYIAETAKPGQFVNIKCGDGLTPLLRRPVSICDIDREKQTFDIVFQVKGEGTANLSKMCCTDVLDYIGPLGNGFDISKKYKKIIVVGGGIGIFPLLFLLKDVNSDCKTSILGFRSKQNIILQEKFSCFADNLFISTDDGSFGVKGFVTDILEEELKKEQPDIIYTCGPTPMIKSVAQVAQQFNILCQVSMEQRMGCGIGACLVCACKTKFGDEWEYSHVCKDGPVFWSTDVIFE